MADHSAPSTSGETATARQRVSIPRVLILFGTVGTLGLVLNGFRLAFGGALHRETLTELLSIAGGWVVIAVWALSPFWGAARLQRRALTTRPVSNVVVLAALAIVALGANSFLVTSAFVGGRPHPTADGMTIVLIPLMQWIVLGLARLRLRTGPGTQST